MSKFCDTYFSAVCDAVLGKINKDLPYSDSLWHWEKIPSAFVGNDNVYWQCRAEYKFYFGTEEGMFVYLGYGTDSLNANCGIKVAIPLYFEDKSKQISSAEFLDSVCPHLLRQFKQKFPHATVSAACGNFDFITGIGLTEIQTQYCCEITVQRKSIKEVWVNRASLLRFSGALSKKRTCRKSRHNKKRTSLLQCPFLWSR